MADHAAPAAGSFGAGILSLRWNWAEVEYAWPEPPPRVELRRPGSPSGRWPATPLENFAGTVELRATAGDWDLVLAAAGFDVWSTSVELGQAPVLWDLEVAALPGMSGRCVDPSGRPVEGADVLLSPTRIGRNVKESVRTVTARDGSFLVPALPREPFYAVSASAAGHAEAKLHDVALTLRGVTRVPDLVLEPAWSVRGTVVDDSGRGVEACTVVLSAGQRNFRTSSDAEGRFQVDAVPPVELLAWTEHRTLTNDRRTVSAALGDRDVSLALTEGAWIEGTVRLDDGASPKGLRLWGFPRGLNARADDAEYWAFRREAVCEGDAGAFRIGPFPPGRVELQESIRTLSKHVVDAPSAVQLVLPAPSEWSVVLRLVDAERETPVQGEGRMSLRWSRESQQGGISKLPIEPDARGEVMLARSIPRDAVVSLVLEVEDYHPALLENLSVTLQGGTTCLLRLSRMQHVEIVVRDADERPVEAADVAVIWQCDRSVLDLFRRAAVDGVSGTEATWFESGSALRFHGMSDSEGRLRIPRLGSAAAVVLVNAAGFSPKVQRFTRMPSGPLPEPGKESQPDVRLELERIQAGS